ncbi:MAG: DUF4302 domain-containing protein [Bacteroidota bacterium]|nr:DUF4302 domain-containing protein [Bacteroidota bacterium]
MKSRILLSIAVATSALVSFSSCQKETEDIFKEPVSARVSASVAEIKKVLTEAENGWSFYYFPSNGVPSMMTLTFTDTKVSVSSEADPSKVVSSYYSVRASEDVSLLFDTYNSILHADATPSITQYQANKGDFDFKVVKCTPEEIELHGTRFGSICRMYPLEGSSRDFLQKVKDNSERFVIGSVSAKIGGGDVVATFDLLNRVFSIGRLGAKSNEITSLPFIINDKNVQLYQPLPYNGKVLYDFSFDIENARMQSGDVVFDWVKPEGYMTYDSYVGKYTMTANDKSFPVELKVKKESKSYDLVGLNPNYNVEVVYDAGNGALGIVFQSLGVYDGASYVLCPWDSITTYYTWTPGVGIRSTTEDNTIPNFTLSFVDNGVWDGYKADSFLIRKLDSTGKPTNDSPASAMFFATGSYALVTPTMTKIAE